jgi:hypothetical protein
MCQIKAVVTWKINTGYIAKKLRVNIGGGVLCQLMEDFDAGACICCPTDHFLCQKEDHRCSVIHQFHAVRTNGGNMAHHFFY